MLEFVAFFLGAPARKRESDLRLPAATRAGMLGDGAERKTVLLYFFRQARRHGDESEHDRHGGTKCRCGTDVALHDVHSNSYCKRTFTRRIAWLLMLLIPKVSLDWS